MLSNEVKGTVRLLPIGSFPVVQVAVYNTCRRALLSYLSSCPSGFTFVRTEGGRIRGRRGDWKDGETLG
eukprot:2478584-Prymnesium_polylepis.1